MLGRLPGQQAWLMDHLAVAAFHLPYWQTPHRLTQVLVDGCQPGGAICQCLSGQRPSPATRSYRQQLVSAQRVCSLSVGLIALYSHLPAWLELGPSNCPLLSSLAVDLVQQFVCALSISMAAYRASWRQAQM